MQTHRWFNQSHPRNLQNAVILLYLNAAYSLIFGLLGGGVLGGSIGIVPLAGVAGGYGIANDKKWGYYLACLAAIIPLAIVVLAFIDGYHGILSLNLIFEIILVVLLFSQPTREYVRIWFK